MKKYLVLVLIVWMKQEELILNSNYVEYIENEVQMHLNYDKFKSEAKL